MSALLFVRACDFCNRNKRKEKPDGTKQLPTAPAARGNTIMRVWFSPVSYGSCTGKFKGVHPIRLEIIQRNNL